MTSNDQWLLFCSTVSLSTLKKGKCFLIKKCVLFINSQRLLCSTTNPWQLLLISNKYVKCLRYFLKLFFDVLRLWLVHLFLTLKSYCWCSLFFQQIQKYIFKSFFRAQTGHQAVNFQFYYKYLKCNVAEKPERLVSNLMR